MTLNDQPAQGTVQSRSSAELNIDYRARRALEEAERAERKLRELQEQCSELNSARVRVRAWEKAHGLRLPADTTHPILLIVAAATRLTLAEVLEEQRARVVGAEHA
ncbi:MAG TPA: hypothetical protein VMU67_04275 [Steroidobacteraceae bacterium]|nr:hypothetical protein [Steroidobacteraceae bacterium]